MCPSFSKYKDEFCDAIIDLPRFGKALSPNLLPRHSSTSSALFFSISAAIAVSPLSSMELSDRLKNYSAWL